MLSHFAYFFAGLAVAFVARVVAHAVQQRRARAVLDALVAEAREEDDRGAGVMGLRALDDGSVAAQLAHEMSELSEEYWCAGWLSGCEFELWRMVQDLTVRNWGMGAVADDQIDSLRALSEKCGGWIVWFGEGKDSGERFVPMAEWLEMYAKHEAGLAEWHKARTEKVS